jgi:hypothetical protein
LAARGLARVRSRIIGNTVTAVPGADDDRIETETKGRDRDSDIYREETETRTETEIETLAETYTDTADTSTPAPSPLNIHTPKQNVGKGRVLRFFFLFLAPDIA